MTMYNINLAKAGTVLNIDSETLPAISQAFIFEYGLRQILNDCASQVKKGEKDAAGTALALAEKRLAKLVAGDFTRSNGSTKLSGFEAEMEKALHSVAVKVAKAKVANFAKLDKDAKADVIAKLVAHPKIIAQAEPIAQSAWAAKQGVVDFDLDDLLA